jgi:hypothetical protein
LTHDTQANNCCLDSQRSFLLDVTFVTAIFTKVRKGSVFNVSIDNEYSE